MEKYIPQKVKRFGLKLVAKAKLISLPGLDSMPIYNVALFFWKSIYDGAITTRASAIAFSFFLALFPAIIFIFTLIPYIPITNFQTELFLLIQNVLPEGAFNTIQLTVEDIINRRNGGWLSVGFFMALIFSTNGIASLMSAFDASVHDFERRNWLNQRMISIVLLAILVVLVGLGVSLIVGGQWVLDYLVSHEILQSNLTYYLIWMGKWLVTVGIFFFSISFVYYYAPAKRTRWRFISAGGTLAAVLCLITSLGFSFYINNFGQYNKLYGSIGTILVVLLWLYFNAIALLIGFELNASINQARQLPRTKGIGHLHV
ncbi:YihY/virulence factor BrkB family protein [Prolixibacteraceae bacterium JC049]|nr:YihY/virulence factor BrkB family protein [Prolixibacteraceae bacterium JC049]